MVRSFRLFRPLPSLQTLESPLAVPGGLGVPSPDAGTGLNLVPLGGLPSKPYEARIDPPPYLPSADPR